MMLRMSREINHQYAATTWANKYKVGILLATFTGKGVFQMQKLVATSNERIMIWQELGTCLAQFLAQSGYILGN